MKVFDLLIYAIIALALILLLYTVISNILPQQTSIIEIKNALTKAALPDSIGEIMPIGALTYYKGASIQKNVFEEEKIPLVIMECVDPENCCIKKSEENQQKTCDKPFEWDYDYFQTKSTMQVITSTRCLKYENTPKCTIYFGTIPAQTKISEIKIIGTTNNTIEIETIIKNTGATQLAFGKTTLKLYKKSVNQWIETEYNENPKETNELMPKESLKLYWSLNPANPGTYKAEFTFEALNAGYSKKTIEFEKKKSSTCETNTTLIDTLPGENGEYHEMHYCTNCEYSYDCANAWTNKLPGKTFYPMTKEQTYCKKQTETGEC